MSQVVRRIVPLFLISIIGTLLVLEYFLNIPALTGFKAEMSLWSIIIYNGAALTGAAFFWMNHGKKLISKVDDMQTKVNSAVAIISFLVVLIVAILYGPQSNTYNKLYTNVLLEVMLTTFGIIFIYSVEASYHALRLSKIDSLALFISGVSYLLREIPIAISFFPAIIPFSEWIMNYPAKGALAVGVLSAAVGSLMVGIRTIAQRERALFD